MRIWGYDTTVGIEIAFIYKGPTSKKGLRCKIIFKKCSQDQKQVLKEESLSQIVKIVRFLYLP